MTKRRKFSDQFKAKVALEALRGGRKIQETAAKEALDEAITQYGPPEIMNTPSRGLQANPCRAVDQGSQFTGAAWITTLTEAGVEISRWI